MNIPSIWVIIKPHGTYFTRKEFLLLFGYPSLKLKQYLTPNLNTQSKTNDTRTLILYLCLGTISNAFVTK